MSQSAYQNVLCCWELHVRTNQALLSLSLCHICIKLSKMNSVPKVFLEYFFLLFFRVFLVIIWIR